MALTVIMSGIAYSFPITAYKSINESAEKGDKESLGKIQMFTIGLISGLNLMQLNVPKEKKMYCIKDGETISAKTLRKMIDVEIAAPSVDHSIFEGNVVYLAVWALSRSFPCKGK